MVTSSAWQIFFQRIDEGHGVGTWSSLTTVHCFDDGYIGKLSVAWIVYCAEYWVKELQERMDRYTGCSSITEKMLNMTLDTIQSIKQSLLNDKCGSIYRDDKLIVTQLKFVLS